MIRRTLFAALAFFAAASSAAPSLAAASPVKVALKTSEGTIVVAIDTKRAPITANNFLAYVDQKKFDGTTFYRAARAKGDPKLGFVQGGIRREMRRSMPPIKHEPTSKTGLRHVAGTISMARAEPGSAMGDFFILIGPSPGMDAQPGAKGDNVGYAAFGKLVSGMPVLKRILAARTWPGGSGATKGQMIKEPVKILEARRI